MYSAADFIHSFTIILTDCAAYLFFFYQIYWCVFLHRHFMCEPANSRKKNVKNIFVWLVGVSGFSLPAQKALPIYFWCVREGGGPNFSFELIYMQWLSKNTSTTIHENIYLLLTKRSFSRFANKNHLCMLGFLGLIWCERGEVRHWTIFMSDI